jgi:hypothetical protein
MHIQQLNTLAAAPFQPDESSQNSFIHFQRTIHHQWIAIFILNFLLAERRSLSLSLSFRRRADGGMFCVY